MASRNDSSSQYSSASSSVVKRRADTWGRRVGVRGWRWLEQEKALSCVMTACSSDSRFRRKLRGATGRRLLGTQGPQMLCVAAWVWS